MRAPQAGSAHMPRHATDIISGAVARPLRRDDRHEDAAGRHLLLRPARPRRLLLLRAGRAARPRAPGRHRVAAVGLRREAAATERLRRLRLLLVLLLVVLRVHHHHLRLLLRRPRGVLLLLPRGRWHIFSPDAQCKHGITHWAGM